MNDINFESIQSIPGEIMGGLIGLSIFLLPVLIIATVMYFKNAKARNHNETILSLAEKGMQITPEMLSPTKSRSSELRSALTMLGMGVGLMIFLFAKGGHNWGIGAIPLAIGLGQLVAWRVENKQKASIDNSNDGQA